MKKSFIFGGVLIALIAFMYWGSLVAQPAMTYWKNTPVACLPDGHAQLALHIHPELFIAVDGEQEMIPANVGVTQNCMAEIHTHDATGVLHIETATRERLDAISLESFFEVWGQSLTREGYTLAVRVDGEEVTDIARRQLQDKQVVELFYTSESNL